MNKSTTAGAPAIDPTEKSFEENLNFEYQIVTKGDQSFLLTPSSCYVWGNNSYGQLGLGDKVERLTPTLLDLPQKQKIKTIACGTGHNICLTENNLCYVWGWNVYGQLGLGDTNDRYNPNLLTLENNEKIIFIACGGYHTICLTEKNNSYSWGWNSYGQLGLGDTHNRSTPHLFSLSVAEYIIFLACGSSHSMFISQSGSCFACGSNYYGQLGFGDTTTRLTPTFIPFPNNDKISLITCGYYHTMCITTNDECYVWGWNDSGELGLGHESAVRKPTLFQLPENAKIIHFSCGLSHSVCLTENNLCYVWGGNSFQQLGMGFQNNIKTPTLLNLPKDETISFIICGYNYTTCITSNNLCYVWGDNNCGQLGLNDVNNRSTPTLLKFK